MTTPRISVIMGAYNAQEYIAQAIESILNQTYTDYEFIIINDGSTDDTPNIICRYAKSDPRIIFIDNKENQGLIAVLNQGLDMARGEFIARMDADDISLPQRFEKQVAYLDANPDVGVLGTLIHGFGLLDAPGVQIPVVTVFDLLKQNYIAHPSVMLRKALLDKYNLRYNPEYIHCEDMELWSHLIFKTKFHNIMQVLLMYRVTGNNISSKNWDLQQKTTEKIRDNLRRKLAASGQLRLDDFGFVSNTTSDAEKISLYD